MGRTGTYSLKLALEHLGFGPCHHMADVHANPEQKALWRAAGQGQLPTW
ncbi:sulfotransferase family protein, partial [Mesorhizobium sp. M0244]